MLFTVDCLSSKGIICDCCGLRNPKHVSYFPSLNIHLCQPCCDEYSLVHDVSDFILLHCVGEFYLTPSEFQ